MCWCAVLPENKAIVTRNVLNVRQQHLLQDDVSVIFSIDLDARLQEVDISAPKTRHPDSDHQQLAVCRSCNAVNEQRQLLSSSCTTPHNSVSFCLFDGAATEKSSVNHIIWTISGGQRRNSLRQRARRAFHKILVFFRKHLYKYLTNVCFQNIEF